MSRDTQSHPYEPEPEPWQTADQTAEWAAEESWQDDLSWSDEYVWAVGTTGSQPSESSELGTSSGVRAASADEPGLLDASREAYDDGEDFEDEPRSVDAATWVARGIVVLTIGLVMVVGGLFLGTMLSGSSSTATSTSTTPASTGTTEAEFAVPTEVAAEPETQAPAVKVSAAAPDGPSASGSGAGTTSGTVATQAVTTAAPSPTETTVSRGKSSNTSKPRPTKGN